MRFQVPQFIDVEDKVFGPFTFRQFIYLGGGVGISLLLFKFLSTLWAIIATIPVAAFALALAFYRVNNKPFIQLVESFVRYLGGSRLYIWKQSEPDKKQPPSAAARAYAQIALPKTGESKLKDMSWTIDARPGQSDER